MANTFITPTAVAMTSLATLENYLCMAGLVHRDYSTEFKKVGDTVTIRKPAELSVVEFDGDLSGEYQNVTETSTTIKLDKLLTVPIEVTALDMTLDIRSFNEQIIKPAMIAMSDKIDQKLCQLYVDIPYYETCESTTAISDFTNARKKLSDNKAYLYDRYGVLSPMTAASLLNIDTIHEADKAGTDSGLRNAALGRVMGFELYENQNVQNHAIGTTDLEGAIDNGNVSEGDTTIHIDGLASADTIAKGTILTIADNDGQYVTTSDVVLSSNEADFPIYPALNADITDGDVVTIRAATATTSRENLLFQRNCFAFVNAPVMPPMGGARGATESANGLNINVVYDWDQDRQTNKIVFSILCGFKTLRPELGVRLYDAS